MAVVVDLVGGPQAASPWPGIIAGLGGAALGSIATYLATLRGVRATAKEGEEQRSLLRSENSAQRTHEFELAHEARDEDRKFSVYATLVKYGIYAQLWAKWRAESVTADGDHEQPPEFPPEVKDAESLAVLLGSDPVRDKAAALNVAMQICERNCQEHEKHLGEESVEEMNAQLNAFQAVQGVVDAGVALIDLLREEMGTGTRRRVEAEPSSAQPERF